jgi:hypothetical protein
MLSLHSPNPPRRRRRSRRRPFAGGLSEIPRGKLLAFYPRELPQ